MKKNILLIIFILISSKIFIYAIEGTWTFTNLFSQTIKDGKATLEPLDTEIIKRIVFIDNKSDNNLTIQKAEIEILSIENEYKKYNANYIDFNTLIQIYIQDIEKIILTIFVFKENDNKIWYSYAISPDYILKGKISGTQEHDSIFLNMIGFMSKTFF